MDPDRTEADGLDADTLAFAQQGDPAGGGRSAIATAAACEQPDMLDQLRSRQ